MLISRNGRELAQKCIRMSFIEKDIPDRKCTLTGVVISGVDPNFRVKHSNVNIWKTVKASEKNACPGLQFTRYKCEI